ncbi:hypothetical protein PF008_g15238 [Phytophthora fragariae]|uniref:Uncharacterized protein n=1 Tax=Phytophthora fragariae TaxID=53985 RepID=A0A6G0REU6_9STRA|nr:hypothetical protein PF008_g15238 [Phytophthora fragariae]
MILNHEIEVPGPPPFLKQSMTSTELAIFTDIFLAVEYPLYAHLAPGQQFGDNMSRQAILEQTHAGMEAAPKQKQEVEDFKAAFSRIVLNVDTRVVTFTFKGRQSASRWINWRMPFASKLLTLVDYDGKRERARTTHEMVQLDYYEFTTSVRKGDVSSRGMHWLLTQTFGLQVQEMTHPETGKKGLNDKEWIIIVKGAGCPQKLRETAYIEVDKAAVMIHHHTINVNWPCASCHSPEHPTRYCKTPVAELAQRKQLFDLRVQGPLPSTTGYGVDMLKKGSLPTTLVQLDIMLKQGAYPERLSTSNKREGHVKPRTSV